MDKSDRDIIAGNYKIEYSSDSLDEFRSEKYKDKLIYDSVSSHFVLKLV